MKQGPESEWREEHALAALLPRLRAYLRRFGPVFATPTEDLVQESLLRLLVRIRARRAAADTPLEAVALAIARRVWLEALRRSRGRPRDGSVCSGAWPTAAARSSVERRELVAAIRRILEPALGPMHYAVFATVWRESCTWRNAAERNGWPWSVAEAARKKLRRFLSAEGSARSLLSLLEDFDVIVAPSPKPQAPSPKPTLEVGSLDLVDSGNSGVVVRPSSLRVINSMLPRLPRTRLRSNERAERAGGPDEVPECWCQRFDRNRGTSGVLAVDSRRSGRGLVHTLTRGM